MNLVQLCTKYKNEIRDALLHTTNEGDSDMIPDSKEELNPDQKAELEILKCQETLKILKEEVKRLCEESKDKKAIPEIPEKPARETRQPIIREMGNFKPEASMLPLS